jgi:serine/threonine-protein kinase
MIVTRTTVRTALSVLAVQGLLSLLGAGTAYAQPSEDSKRDPIAAETLFTRGKQLMDQGHVHEACEAFMESQRLDPAGGTLLRLALCREADGKLASAWLEFTEVVRVSQAAAGEQGKLAERVRLARQHLQSIEPRVPKLVVAVAPESRVEGLTVTANGSPRNSGTWGVAIPVDPGDVLVEATAPGRSPFKATVSAVEGKEATVEVPLLEASPSQAPAPGLAASPAPARLEGGTGGSSMRPIALGVAGLGLVAIGVGSVFGVTAMSKWSDSNSHCPPASGCDAQGVSSAHDAKSAAVVSDVTIGVGLAAVAAGAVLYFLGAPKTVQARADGVRVVF